MSVYNISYDLRKTGQDYSGLIKELERSPSWWHFLGSTWLVSTRESASELWERISAHVDENDSILIIRVSPESSGWLPEEAWKWIREHITDAARRY